MASMAFRRPNSAQLPLRIGTVMCMASMFVGCTPLPPRNEPGILALQKIGKPLPDFEMIYGAPLRTDMTNGVQVATWRLADPYHLEGVCWLTVRTDAAGIITDATWTRGCGPQRAKPVS